MLEPVKKICFIYFLLKAMGVDDKLPIVVRCDNVVAIFMAENSSSGIRTRHIDTRYHFVREHVKARCLWDECHSNLILLDMMLVNGTLLEAHFCETTCCDNS
jgi:hypothetical protein